MHIQGLITQNSSILTCSSPFLLTQIGTARRVQSAVGPGQVCLSLSRSLAAGLDWRQQLTLAELQQGLAAAAAAAGWKQQQPPAAAAVGTAATGCRVGRGMRQEHEGDCTPAAVGGSIKGAAAAGQQQRQVHSAPPPPPHLQQQQQQQQQQEGLDTSLQAGTQLNSSSSSGNLGSGTQQQERLQPLHETDMHHQHLQHQQQPPSAQQQYSSCTNAAAASNVQDRPSKFHPAATSGRIRSSRGEAAAALPWQLAASIAHHQHAVQAIRASVQLQQQQQQQGVDKTPGQSCRLNPGSNSSKGGQQDHSSSTERPVVVVLQQQEVVQHQSAARAASAAQQLAARRQQWEQLSGMRPSPYPVFLPDRPPTGL